MNPPDLKPAVDIALQLLSFFINLFLNMIASIPSLPIELKGLLICMLILGLIFGFLKFNLNKQSIEDLLQKIMDVLIK